APIGASIALVLREATSPRSWLLWARHEAVALGDPAGEERRWLRVRRAKRELGPSAGADLAPRRILRGDLLRLRDRCGELQPEVDRAQEQERLVPHPDRAALDGGSGARDSLGAIGVRKRQLADGFGEAALGGHAARR